MQHVRLLILLSLAGPAAGAEGGPLVLTDLAGAYAPGSLPQGGDWLALHCGPAGCELRPASLQLSLQRFTLYRHLFQQIFKLLP